VDVIDELREGIDLSLNNEKPLNIFFNPKDYSSFEKEIEMKRKLHDHLSKKEEDKCEKVRNDFHYSSKLKKDYANMTPISEIQTSPGICDPNTHVIHYRKMLIM
jgi:hypothetical protein